MPGWIMGIVTIIQLIVEIYKLIKGQPKERQAALLLKFRAARQKAQATGDTSDLEKMYTALHNA